MKLIILSILLISMQLRLYSQDWPVGTTWVYWQQAFNPNLDYGTQVLQITRDTNINNVQAKVITAWNILSPEFKYDYIIRVDNGKVWSLSEKYDTFELIYDFNLKPGDSVSYYINSDWDSERFVDYVIDSIQFVKTSGSDKKKIYHHRTGGHNCYFYGDYIIEDVGDEIYFFQGFCAVDPPIGGGLICFTNKSFHIPEKEECEIPTKTKDIVDHEIKIFPNPVSDFFILENTKDHNYNLHLYDQYGKEINIHGFNGIYDLQHLAKGMYFLRIENKQFSQSSKIIKI